MTAFRFNNKDADLIETIASLLESEGDKTKASEFYERLVDVDPKNTHALEKLIEFRDSIGDNYGAREYLERLLSIDPRNQYANENSERIQNGGSMGGTGLLSFLKGIFGSKMRG